MDNVFAMRLFNEIGIRYMSVLFYLSYFHGRWLEEGLTTMSSMAELVCMGGHLQRLLLLKQRPVNSSPHPSLAASSAPDSPTTASVLASPLWYASGSPPFSDQLLQWPKHPLLDRSRR